MLKRSIFVAERAILEHDISIILDLLLDFFHALSEYYSVL